MPGQRLAELIAAAQVADRAEVDAGVTGRGDLAEHALAVGYVRVQADGQLEGPVADRSVRHRDRLPATVNAVVVNAHQPVLSVGSSRGMPRWWLSMMAWHSMMSRRPSRPVVTGSRPATIQSWNAWSSRLNPLS